MRADGSPLWCQVTSIRFLDGDEELGHTQLEDISERKTLEQGANVLFHKTVFRPKTVNLFQDKTILLLSLNPWQLPGIRCQ